MTNQNPTPEDLTALWGVCVQWVEYIKPSCLESLFQVDRVNEALPDLAKKVCAIVGYYGSDSNFEKE